MGIPGLLVALKSYLSSSTTSHALLATSNTGSQNSDGHRHHNNDDNNNKYNGNIYANFQNRAVAVDASSWFHKSVYSIADHYVECIEKLNTFSNGNSNSMQFDAKCINTSTKYMLERCYELLSSHGKNGVSKIYLVMDGERCPLKAITNQERTDKRNKALQLARKYKSQQQSKNKIYEQYKSCIKVVNALSYTVARNIEQHFSSDRRVEIIWSPYEADAQLVQLCSGGTDDERICSAVITEDSDILVYCAACHISFPIIYKLDRQSGNCSILSMDWLIHPTKFRHDRLVSSNNNNTNHTVAIDMKQSTNKVSTIDTIFDVLVGRQIQHPGWGTRLFVQGCVLAGCDYSPRGQIPGVGFINAFKYIQMAGLAPNQLDTVFDRILTSFLPTKSRRLIQNAIPTLENQLSQSEAVFYYHPVLKTTNTTDSHQHIVQYLTDINKIDNEMKYQPSLRRYSNDLSFLGSLTLNRIMGDSGIIPRNMVQQQQHQSNRKRKLTVAINKIDLRPIKTILIPSNTNKVLSDDVSLLSSSTSQQSVVQNENRVPPLLKQQKSSATMVIVNPYQQKRQPLQSLHPFETYALRHSGDEMQEINRIVTAKLPVRSSNNTNKLGHDNNIKDNSLHRPRPLYKPMTSTAVNRKRNIDDVRFVKRTDFGVNIDAEKHIYRVPVHIGRNDLNAKEPLGAAATSTAGHVNCAKEIDKLQQRNVTNVVGSLFMAVKKRLPVALASRQQTVLRELRESPKVNMKSKFFSDRIGEDTGMSNPTYFEIQEECPPLPQSKMDVVSLVDFDQYESQSLLSPNKSPPTFYQNFEYDIPNESPRDEITVLDSHFAHETATNDLDRGIDTEKFGNEYDDNLRSNTFHAHRRVTVELPHDVKTMAYNFHDKKHSNVHEPIQFNFYDTLPFQSPNDQVGTNTDDDIDDIAKPSVNEISDHAVRLPVVKTLKYRLGSVVPGKPSVKKVVKHTNVIQRVIQKHRKRYTNRDPAQTTLLSHFRTERRSVT